MNAPLLSFRPQRKKVVKALWPVLTLGSAFASSACFAQQKPNVVFVFADQMRNHTLGINQEDPTLTPHIDELAAEGIRFTNAISSCPVCSPFRGMLMTGKFPLNTGMTRNCSPETPGMWLRSDKAVPAYGIHEPATPPAHLVPEKYRSRYDAHDILLNRKNVSLTGDGALAEERVRDYFAAVSGVDERIISGELHFELYDLVADQWQLKPLSAQDPEAFDEFEPFYKSLMHSLDKMGDPFLEKRLANEDAYNLIPNPGFEYGNLEKWNNWNNRITNDASHVYEGSWAGVVNGGTKGSIQQSIVLKPNTDYRATLHAKMAKAGETAAFIINNYGGAKIVIPVEGTEYSKYETGFRTGAITEPVIISFYKHNADYSEGYCDNFRLIETGEQVTDIVFEHTGSCSSIRVGSTITVKANVFPETALDRSVTWSVTNLTGEACVDNEGKVTGIQPGLVQVEAAANDGSGVSTTFDLAVLEPGNAVNSINIESSIPGNILQIPETLQLSAVFDPDYICDQAVIWSVNNISGTATVNASGLLKTYGAGAVEVILTSAAYPDISDTLHLNLILGDRDTYYVDASNGDDSNDGLSGSSAWRSLDKVNSENFNPGDSILFKAGETWSGQLEINTQGAVDHPVVFSRYGEGPDPRIDGNGEKDWTLLLLNSGYTEVRDLELTNEGATMKGGRYGAMMHALNEGPVYHSVFRNLTIHNVNGDTDKSKGGGGGIVWKIGGETPSRFVDAIIEDCHVYDCERNGIVGKSAYTAAEYQYKKEYYSLGTQIRRNLIERIPGDGIVILGCDSALVEYNICRDFTDELPDLGGNAAAGIWPWNSHNTVIQYNEVSGHQASWDAQGFDSDYNCDGTIIQYNYSHDNAGGFILICSNGQWNGYNDNTIVRYNISVNDGYRTWGRGANFCPSIHMAGNIFNTRIYNNTIYTKVKPASVDKHFIEATNWNGLPNVTYIYNNIFYAEEPTGFIMGESTNNDFSNNFYSEDASLPADKEPYTGNPLFIDPGTSENVDGYKLQTGSPAIGKGIIILNNGGLDFFGNQVPENARPTIGAHQFDQSTSLIEIETSGKDPGIFLSPNPVKDSFLYVRLKNPRENSKLTITSLTGKVLYLKHLDDSQSTTECIDLSGFRQGMYILSMHTPAGIQSERFIVY